ncbi:MAG TPA: L,D-transpeptidase family protein [Chthoniobacterales bacterium]
MSPRSFLFAVAFLPLALHAQSPRDARPVAQLAQQNPDDPERKEMVKVQIVLDRAYFRPGKIDGLGGEFTQKAADRYNQAYRMEPGTRLDLSSVAEPYREYTVTEADLSWVGKMASTPQEQEKLKRMSYGDSWEAIAEKFHTDLDFLQELNPSLKEPPVVGTVLRVPDVEPFDMQAVADLEKHRNAEAKARKQAKTDGASADASPTPAPAYEPKRRLVLLREPRLIELYEDDKLVGCFPCTPGSPEQPVPDGNYKITSNTLLPYFRWDKSVLETGKRSDTAYNLPPGPNNPVGIVWLAINIPSRGIHGTPSPDQIGRNQSHGCIRTANWDAWILAQRIKGGTPVEVRSK